MTTETPTRTAATVHYNTPEMTEAMIRSLWKQSGRQWRVVVLDNSDIDAMLQIIYEERGLTLRDYTYARARDMFEIRKCITEPGYYLDMITLSLDELKAKK